MAAGTLDELLRLLSTPNQSGLCEKAKPRLFVGSNSRPSCAGASALTSYRIFTVRTQLNTAWAHTYGELCLFGVESLGFKARHSVHATVVS